MLRRVHVSCDAPNLGNILIGPFGELVRASVDPENSPVAVKKILTSIPTSRQWIPAQFTFVGRGTRICSRIESSQIRLGRKRQYVSVIQLDREEEGR